MRHRMPVSYLSACLSVVLSVAVYAAPCVAAAQVSGIPPTTRQIFPTDPGASVPALSPISSSTTSELAEVVSRYSADVSSLQRRYDTQGSQSRNERLKSFYLTWRQRLSEMNFNKLSREGQVDYILLDNHLRYQLDLMQRDEVQRKETELLLPFANDLLKLQEDRRNLMAIDGQKSAQLLAAITKQVDSLRSKLEPSAARPSSDSGGVQSSRNSMPKISRTAANRAADNIDQVRSVVTTWYRYYNGYDPMFSWWVTSPWQQLDESLRRYSQTVRQRLVGIQVVASSGATGAGGGPAGRAGGAGAQGAQGGPPSGGARNAAAANEPIIGDPIGAEGLAADLRAAMVPYTAEELIAIAEKEYAFSEAEAKKAARQMGFGDDWKAAMEKIKNSYVEPGKQPDLIRDLANEAEAFFDKHDWVTIPALAREDWRMEMLSPDRQRVSPFFLGGENILVAYPTNDMTEEEKLMSLRGNNPHFSRAVVFHELNPGHHLQGFISARYNQHRRMFSTPFWSEGQSLYWEMFLWDRDFHVTPEDRLGALAWRMHRSARIVFSLSFHLGKMTPEQCIEYLVDKVPFERANSEAEVRRSFNGSYSPIYQAAYMLGGLQLRALYQELVASGKMTDRQFHDAVLQGGPMPIAMVRARLTNIPLTREGAAPWRFADHLPAPRPFPVK